MNIYFFIDELHRDSITASKLKARLNERKHHIYYGSRTTINFLKYFHSFFDVIIIPRISFLMQHFGDSWLIWKQKIVTLSTESIGIIAEDSHLCAKTILEKEYFEGKKKYANRIDLFALWGFDQLKAVKKYAPELKKKFFVIGHPRYDSFNLENYKKTNKKKVIGIITRAPSINDYYDRSIIDFFSLNLDGKKYEYFNKKKKRGLIYKRNSLLQSIILESIDIQNTIKIIQMLHKKNFEIIIRQHPKEKDGQWKKILTKISNYIQIHDKKLPIHDFLGKIDYLIGPPSTSFYEAFMFKVEPISICGLDKKRKLFAAELAEDNNRLMTEIFKPKFIREIFYHIKKKKNLKINYKVKNILKNELNYPSCINSLETLVLKIELLANNYKKKFYFSFIYRFYCEIYFLLWNLRNYFVNRKIHSAYFPLNFRTINFIESINR